MTLSQRRKVEWPLLLIIFWLFQGIEVGLLRSFVGIGYISLAAPIVVFMALYWSFYKTVGLSFVILFIGSVNVPFPAPLYLAANLWAVMITKFIANNAAIEGRRDYAFLVGIFQLVAFVIMVFLSYFYDIEQPISFIWYRILYNVAFNVILGWLLFPVIRFWFELFGHDIEDSSELELRHV